MDQSEFSVAGATGNSNAFVTVSSAVPFFSFSPPVSSRLFLLAPVSLRCERTLSTDQKGTACSLCPRGREEGLPSYEWGGDARRLAKAVYISDFGLTKGVMGITPLYLAAGRSRLGEPNCLQG